MTLRNTIAIATCSLLIAACGKQDAQAPAAAPASTSAPAPAPAAAPAAGLDEAALAAGKSAYGKACALCHAAGVGGAPKPGDKVDWAERIAQGNDMLYKHALEGYTGKKGTMPPKGGSSLAETDVKAAVDFMVGQSK